MALMLSATQANAGNVTQQPDPELLRKFEAERDAAEAQRKQAEELRKQGDAKVQQGQAKQERALDALDAELCSMGALPASECP